ncbi:MAG: flavodoxin family protein [Actinomycetes bacterium]
MRAMVIFESMFGNTEAVARAVADGLATRMDVDVVHVEAAQPVLGSDVRLLVVGGPTHAFGMSRAGTRRAAMDQGAHPTGTANVGLREWLADLRRESASVAGAAFDTRIRKRGVPGSAARGAQKRLRRLGFGIATPARSFYVTGTPGPLLEGELARAREWGSQLASGVAASEEGRAVT